MTQLAHDAVMLEIGVDTYRLYAGDDPNYETWLSVLTDKVLTTKREQEARAKRKK